MPRDEELRKVAEDLRALGRSLARDARAAVDDAMRSGRPLEAVRESLRGAAGEARRAARQGWGGPHRRGCSPGPPWGRAGQYGPPWTRSSGPPWVRPGGPPGPRPGWGRHGPARPYPPVRRKWDAATIVGLLAVLFGTAWLLGAVGALHVPIESVLAVGLMVLGAGILVTARTDWSLSRHMWPVVVGLVLLGAVITTSSGLGVPGALRHISVGNMGGTAAAGKTVYGGFGDLTVNATNVAAGKTFKVQSDAGQTTITTTSEAPVLVHAQVLAGDISVCGKRQANGVNARVDGQFGHIGGPPVTVDARQLFGEIIINGGDCGRS